MADQTFDIVLNCQNLTHYFEDPLKDKPPTKVLHDINLQIVRGEIVGVVGPSGCGKSTLLRAITGTHPPKQGKVIVHSKHNGDNEIIILEPSRNIGIVYQQYSLFPFLTALQNVAFGPMLDKTSILFRFFRFIEWKKIRHEQLSQAKELLAKLNLENAMHLYPSQLSGGMKQRVAIAQALIMKPEILLLDEPFGALDEVMRESLQRMLLRLYLENCLAKQKGDKPPYTILMVTHEIKEAIIVSDRVIGLSQYWDYQNAGFAECPGSTIVYDRVAEIYQPDTPNDFKKINDQADEIRKAVFDSKNLQRREQFNNFWKQITCGQGDGVLENGNQHVEI